MEHEQDKPGRPGKLKTVIERSSGGVVGREANGQLQVVLIATRDRTRWGLPKGLVGQDETPLDAARREVGEETGLQVRTVEPLASIEYWYRRGGTRVHKFVDFFLFAYESGDVADHDWEVDEAAWMPIDEAMRRASYQTERDVLHQAKEAWANAGNFPKA